MLPHDMLLHYGVKGMRWHVRKKPEDMTEAELIELVEMGSPEDIAKLTYEQISKLPGHLDRKVKDAKSIVEQKKQEAQASKEDKLKKEEPKKKDEEDDKSKRKGRGGKGKSGGGKAKSGNGKSKPLSAGDQKAAKAVTRISLDMAKMSDQDFEAKYSNMQISEELKTLAKAKNSTKLSQKEYKQLVDSFTKRLKKVGLYKRT